MQRRKRPLGIEYHDDSEAGEFDIICAQSQSLGIMDHVGCWAKVKVDCATEQEQDHTLQMGPCGNGWQRYVHSTQPRHLCPIRQVQGLHHDCRPAQVLIQAEQQEGRLKHDRAALGTHRLQVPGPH